jgi:hypothetical protein
VNFSGTPDIILQKAKDAVLSQGGFFEGDLTSGIFKVNLLSNDLEGSYKVVGQDLELTIDKKPLFIPCNAIEGYLKSKLSK